MNRSTGFALTATFLWAATAGAVPVSSDQLKSMLEARSAKVNASKIEAEAAAEREGFFARSFMPSIEAQVAQENFKKGRGENKTQPAYGIEARLNLFNGGRDRLRGEIRQLRAREKTFGSQRTLAEELEKTRPVYWNLLFLRDKIELLKETLQVNKSSLNSALRRIKNGVATDSDRFEFEMRAVDVERELAQAEVQFKSETRLLALLLGLPLETKFELGETWSHDHDLTALLKHDHADHEFLIKESELQAEQMRLSAKEAGRVWWPKLDAFAAYNQFTERVEEFPDAEDRKESVLGLRLSMHLPEGLESSRESAALAREAEAQRLRASFQRQEIDNHLNTEMDELKVLHDQVHASEDNVERAERYNRLTQSEYMRGVKNSPDVLGASEKLYGMKFKRLEILRDFQVAKSHLLSKMGK